MSWRRGWDSNPRNGFPFTAFPVLPIQPLLHLSREIADFRLPIEKLDLILNPKNRQSPIGNRQCYWRRGWDLNPRWSFPHSGFRDRCTKPLCDLSVSGRMKAEGGRMNKNPSVSNPPYFIRHPSSFRLHPSTVPPRAKKLLHYRAALFLKNSSADLNSMIQKIRVANAKSRRDGTGLFIGRAINQPPHSCLDESSRAHCAGLDRRIDNSV